MPEASPTVDIWTEEGQVCIVILNATVIEYKDQLTPGCSFTPSEAVIFATELLKDATKALLYLNSQDNGQTD